MLAVQLDEVNPASSETQIDPDKICRRAYFRLRVELQSSPTTPIREVKAQPYGLMTLRASTFPAITEQPVKLR